MELWLRFLAVLTLAWADDFGWTHAKLEANITLQADSSWHLGGFCFGQADSAETSKVAEIWIHVKWEGSVPLNDTGPVYIVAFDTRSTRWGAVKDSWDEATCQEKLKVATMTRKLGQYSRSRRYWFRVHVHQALAMRDWHFALLTCGKVEQAPLLLELEAADGALSMFQANSNFHTSSCPSMPGDWWQVAQEAFGFSLVIACTLGAGGAMGACIGPLRKRCARRQFDQMALAQGSEPVVGKPCTLLGRTNAGIVQGQPHEAQKETVKGSGPPTGQESV